MNVYTFYINLVEVYVVCTYTTGISIFSDGAKTHGKIRIPSEKYFSDGVPSEKYPQKYNDRKIKFFCGFTVRNNFSVGLTRTEKLCSPRLKLIFLCVSPHRKKEINAQKNTCFFSFGLVNSQKNSFRPD